MMIKTEKRSTYFFLSILCIVITTLMIGCSSDSDGTSESTNTSDESENTAAAPAEETNDNESPEEGSHLYHEIGETFELEGYSSGVPAEITVNDIWTEDREEHQEFIEDSISSPSEENVVVFVDYTVENIGDRSMSLGDVIPEYAGPNGDTDLDLSYPENDTFTDIMEPFQENLEEGETMDLIGAIATEEKAPYTNALMWNFMQDVPEIVFHTPQDERRDQIGTYDIGEDMYIVDYGGDTFYKVNIGNVEITEEPEEIEQRDDSDGFIAIDMTFENQLDEEVLLHQTFPQPYIVDKQLVGHSPYLVLDNELVQDLYDGSEGKIAPGETVEGTVYLEIINDNTEDVQLLYPNPSLLTFPDYGMWINYNLED